MVMKRSAVRSIKFDPEPEEETLSLTERPSLSVSAFMVGMILNSI